MAYNTDTTGNAGTADKLKTARTVQTNLASTSTASFDGSASITPGVTGTLPVSNGGTGVTTNLAEAVGYGYFPPGYVSGNYYQCNSFGVSSTNGSLGNGSVRVTAWIVTASITITRLFAEFTAAGDANSVFRIGIWNHDSTTGKPGSLVLDAGTISTGTGNAGNVSTGGTPGVYEITVSQALSPGLYWVGGAVQGVTTTQPTMRIVNVATVPMFFPLGTSLPGANNQSLGWSLGGTTGAFGSLASAVPAGTTAPRIGFKVS